MTQELVDKFMEYADDRRKERENSLNPADDARKRLKELGYLDENGEISAAYSQTINKTLKRDKVSV